MDVPKNECTFCRVIQRTFFSGNLTVKYLARNRARSILRKIIKINSWQSRTKLFQTREHQNWACSMTFENLTSSRTGVFMHPQTKSWIYPSNPSIMRYNIVIELTITLIVFILAILVTITFFCYLILLVKINKF